MTEKDQRVDPELEGIVSDLRAKRDRGVFENFRETLFTDMDLLNLAEAIQRQRRLKVNGPRLANLLPPKEIRP